MTIEYVMLLAVASLVLMPALMKAPKAGMTEGSARFAARVETQLATGGGFNPYKGGGDAGKPNWKKKD